MSNNVTAKEKQRNQSSSDRDDRFWVMAKVQQKLQYLLSLYMKTNVYFQFFIWKKHVAVSLLISTLLTKAKTKYLGNPFCRHWVDLYKIWWHTAFHFKYWEIRVPIARGLLRKAEMFAYLGVEKWEPALFGTGALLPHRTKGLRLPGGAASVLGSVFPVRGFLGWYTETPKVNIADGCHTKGPFWKGICQWLLICLKPPASVLASLA